MSESAVPPEVTAFFAGHPLGLAVHRRICRMLAATPGWQIRVTKSQVAFHARRGFAYLWLPGRYLAHPTADLVLSIVLERRESSPRFKEVVRPSPGHWIHHLEVHSEQDVDEEVAGWLREAAAAGLQRQERSTATLRAPEATGSSNNS